MVDIKTNPDQDEGRVAPEQSAEAKALTEDSAAAELEVAKLATDLDQLRQTLLRHVTELRRNTTWGLRFVDLSIGGYD